MNNIIDKTLQQFFIAILRLVYNVKDVAFLEDGKSMVFKTPSGGVKYATSQYFDYEPSGFVFNRTTFEGERGVVQMSRAYTAVFNSDNLKAVLEKHKKHIKKNKHGDWEVDWSIVNGVVRKVAKKG